MAGIAQPDRRTLIRCKAVQCGTVLGWTTGDQRALFIAPVETSPLGHFKVICPVCGCARSWQASPPVPAAANGAKVLAGE